MKKNEAKCPIDHTVTLLSGKWKLCIIRELVKKSPMRFTELEREIAGITPTMLTAQLRQFEEELVVHRKVYPTVPPTVEYSLTEIGTAMEPMIMELEKWGLKHMALLNA
jgi:DNA-binding HxlR family transcriptional regulator